MKIQLRKSMKTAGRTLGAVAVTSMLLTATAQAGHRHDDYDYAKVSAVEPIYRTVSHRVPQQHCWVETARYDHHDGHHSNTATIVGGVIGAAIGNNLSHKRRHRKAGAVAGAILGASIGADISAKNHHHHTVTEYRDVERCETRYQVEREQRLVGYDVTYRYLGRTYTTRMDHHPGKRIKVAVSVRPSF